MSASCAIQPAECQRPALGDFGNPAERALPVAHALRPWVADLRVISLADDCQGTCARWPQSTASLVVCARGDQLDVMTIGPQLRAFYKPAGALPQYVRASFR